ncbi:MAG: type II toxin-antitoxin system RelE/ParE family toxin [gamma proteobacterium endosymbiont of Lamellibrachia anaximandri]|nr:type II toxin-antitoxin system RelE/ParE family toxin [gamma proteobacterium endosymbiont of Lamellibrachia anaximandri]MBL3619753.1 type II toxin-antitoxin system RelE/ParE family toxin [gamma proteobacterium endosymbiont of Lamellibrachia anaximandri]
MTYNIKFLPSALKEWKKLAPPVQKQFKKKLNERVINPRIQASQLRGFKDVYKIKLRSVGYRLVYEVNDAEITVYVIAIGKRERGLVYSKAEQRK